jgi:hypothetical protein
LAKVLFVGTSALATSIWIAICCAAPEFIWQGLQIALAHPSWTELFSALLIGLILAFFVEPIMERVRDMVRPSEPENTSDGEPRHALFTVTLSLAFALASVCLHDAITAFVSGHGGDHSEADAALAAGVVLVTAWAFVPLAVTLAWLSVWHRRLRVPMGVFGGTSPLLAGWLFDWPLQSVITTSIPCLVILGLGYRRLLQEPGEHGFARFARLVALVAAIWLASALLFDAALRVYQEDNLALYDATDFWTDVRFYVGWVLGLMLAPWPFHRPTDATTELSG